MASSIRALPAPQEGTYITTDTRVDFTHPTRTKPTSIPGQIRVDFRLFDSIVTFNSTVTDVGYSHPQPPLFLTGSMTTLLALTDIYDNDLAINESIEFGLNEIGLERWLQNDVIDALEDTLIEELTFLCRKASFSIQLQVEAVVDIHRVSIEYNLPESMDSLDQMICRELAMRGLVRVKEDEGLFIDDDDDKTRNCAICLNELFDCGDGYYNYAVKLPNCRHVFHESCIAKWCYKSTQQCPLCRCSCVRRDEYETMSSRFL